MHSPQLETIVSLLRSRPQPERLDPAEARAAMEAMVGTIPAPADVAYEPVDAGGVPAEWTRAEESRDDRHVLYLHGGGYVIGSPRTHRNLVGRLAKTAGARALSVDYRLAPESPHPAAVEDAVAAWEWMLAQGADPARAAIGGDSAGGGLTVATLVALRDRGLPLPAAAVCLSPWVDLEGTGASMTERAHLDPMVQKDGLLQMAAFYLAGQDARTPLAAPLHADLTGLPPMLIQVGTAETLYDDAVRLAEKAEAAGVDVTLEPWDDMIHVFQAFAGMLPEGERAIERLGEYLRKHIG
ncbi:MAG: alpha/beta hydrolase [Myxococcota bacterium]|nr:alpha/beta hydrolase [Myxococcota bacterium]